MSGTIYVLGQLLFRKMQLFVFFARVCPQVVPTPQDRGDITTMLIGHLRLSTFEKVCGCVKHAFLFLME